MEFIVRSWLKQILLILTLVNLVLFKIQVVILNLRLVMHNFVIWEIMIYLILIICKSRKLHLFLLLWFFRHLGIFLLIVISTLIVEKLTKSDHYILVNLVCRPWRVNHRKPWWLVIKRWFKIFRLRIWLDLQILLLSVVLFSVERSYLYRCHHPPFSQEVGEHKILVGSNPLTLSDFVNINRLGV